MIASSKGKREAGPARASAKDRRERAVLPAAFFHEGFVGLALCWRVARTWELLTVNPCMDSRGCIGISSSAGAFGTCQSFLEWWG